MYLSERNKSKNTIQTQYTYIYCCGGSLFKNKKTRNKQYIHLDMESVDSNTPPVHRLQGMKLRDEFLCPITHEIFKDPVVACDGHTYERSSIEKWLKTKNISPRSGVVMVIFMLQSWKIVDILFANRKKV